MKKVRALRVHSNQLKTFWNSLIITQLITFHTREKDHRTTITLHIKKKHKLREIVEGNNFIKKTSKSLNNEILATINEEQNKNLKTKVQTSTRKLSKINQDTRKMSWEQDFQIKEIKMMLIISEILLP